MSLANIIKSFQSHTESHLETKSEFRSASRTSATKLAPQSHLHTSSFTELSDAVKFQDAWYPLKGKEDHRCGSMFDSEGKGFQGWMSPQGDMCDEKGGKMDGKACEMYDAQGEQVQGWLKDDGEFCDENGTSIEGFEVFNSEGKKINPAAMHLEEDTVSNSQQFIIIKHV